VRAILKHTKTKDAVRAILNHTKKKKAEASQLILWKL